jgi:drug/metabolite transporter (DMT)-like permease
MVKRKKTIQGVLCVIGCEILFGFAFLFTKEITNSVSPIDLLSWRFIIAFLLFSMCELTGILKVNLKQKSVSSLFWMGVFVPVMYYLGETYGIKLTSASESGVIIACIPVVTLLLSTVILKESPTKLCSQSLHLLKI